MTSPEFLCDFAEYLAAHEAEGFDEWDMIALVQAFCLMRIMRLNQPARDRLGQRVEAIAAALDGRTVH